MTVKSQKCSALRGSILLLLAFSAQGVGAARLHDGSHLRGEVLKPKGSAKFLKAIKQALSSSDKATKVMNVKCSTTFVANSKAEFHRTCPVECPFIASDRNDDRHCTFQCVEGHQCPSMNPNKPIPDEELGVCRAPNVEACSKPMLDGTDRCQECDYGYYPNSGGKCHLNAPVMIALYVLGAVLAIAVVLIVVWVVDILCRPVTNEAGLQRGLWVRELMKFQRQAQEGEEDQIEIGFQSQRSLTAHETHLARPYPLSTNLCKQDVAGPGMVLHFKFQVAIMVWGLLMATVWLCLGIFVSSDLFVLGIRPLSTPRENCIVIAWGYETQQKLMWTKVLFLQIAYVSSFVLALVHSITQLHTFEVLDNEYKTMRDFAVMLKDVPEVWGDQRLEESLASEFRKQHGIDTVGVSVAWNFKGKQEEVMSMIKRDPQLSNESTDVGQDPAGTDPTKSMNPLRKMLYKVEASIFLSGATEEVVHEVVQELLSNMKSSSSAFIVFHTEAERDLAKNAIIEKGFQFNGSTIGVEEVYCEPTTVQWENFDGSGNAMTTWRIIKGFGWIFLALVAWTLFFYAPYAWSILGFNYDNGNQPGVVYSLAFSMVVVIGNNIMYNTCDFVSTAIGFRFRDDKEASYMIMYTIACTFNILIDFITTYVMAWKIMVGLGFRTYDGRRLEEVSMFPEGFETYAMQRSLAENTYAYAFPSTYLIPFLLEPLVTNVLFLWIGKLIVRTHKECSMSDAEDNLASLPMEMGRYGDILLNVVLFIMIFFFPGAYTARLGFYLAICHAIIYVWDHYRVLRVIPSCTFASMVIDWWSQAMLAPCCGLILSVLIFKSKNQEGGPMGLGAWEIVGYCTAGFVGHCIVHILLLVYIVPLFAKEHEDLDKSTTYDELLEKVSNSWFNTNPVYCLRSKYVYKERNPIKLFSRKSAQSIPELPSKM